jgi:hypothetical protein
MLFTAYPIGKRWERLLPQCLFPLILLLCCPLALADGGLGSTWIHVKDSAEWGVRNKAASTVFGGKLWIMGGDIDSGLNALNDVWSSTDGTTWIEVTAAAQWAPRVALNAVSFNGELVVMGGQFSNFTYATDVWSSANGVTWAPLTSSAPWAPRVFFGLTVFQNKLWLVGGYDGTDFKNDVWSSTNGTIWTRETAAAAWAPRVVNGLVVLDNQLWLAGGFNSDLGQYFGDVWRTSDGVNWTQVTGAAPWRARDGHGFVAYQNQMWILAGIDDTDTPVNDVWRSADGLNWTRATDAPGWPAHFWGNANAFNSRLWRFAGISSATGALNDVWFTENKSSLAGTVRDANSGLEIACAAIRVNATDLPRALATTDLRGRYRVDGIEATTVSVTAFAPGYTPQTINDVPLNVNALTYRHFELVPATDSGGINGRLTDVNTGRALPLVQVDAKIGGQVVKRTFSCANGRYELLGLAAKGGDTTVDIEYSSDGYNPLVDTVNIPPDAVLTSDQSMQKSVPAPGSLAGTVRSKTSGNPLQDARVTIQGLGDISVVTDVNGIYTFAAIPEDTYSVRASALGFSGDTQQVGIEALSISNFDFTLDPQTTGDVNLDAAVNASDVQLVINSALGIYTGLNCDLNEDAVVNAVDVQGVINAALGLKSACDCD